MVCVVLTGMPKCAVPTVAEQAPLFVHRHLLPPSDSAVPLGITSQAVEKSAARPAGQIVVWSCDGTACGRRYRPSYVDYGRRTGQPNPKVWQQYRDDPWAIVRQAVQEARDSTPTSDAVPGSTGTEVPAFVVRRPNADDSLLILQLVASGLAQFGRRLGEDSPQFRHYPEPLQKGLDKLTFNGLRFRVESPASVPDVLQWCRSRPVSEWSPRMPAG